MIGQSEVLTAAHCVSNTSSNPIGTAMVQICRDDINACAAVTDVDIPANYGGGNSSCCGTDIDDDWAVIELVATWSTIGFANADTMALSEASNTRVGDLTNVHNVAFPGWSAGCTQEAGNNLYEVNEAEPVAGILTQRLRFKIDGAPGNSGSPLFYCPAGDDNVCAGDDQGWVLAVWSGWNTTNNRMVGPRVKDFKPLAIAFRDD